MLELSALPVLAGGINLDTQLLSMVVGLVIPLIVALITKSTAGKDVKTAVNVGLSVVGGALAPVIAQGGHLVYKDFLYSIILAVLTAAAVHQGVYKPSGLSDAVDGLSPGFIGGGTPNDTNPVQAPAPSEAPVSPPVPVNAVTPTDPSLPDPPAADGPTPATPQGWVLVAIPKPSVMKAAAKK